MISFEGKTCSLSESIDLGRDNIEETGRKVHIGSPDRLLCTKKM